MKDFKSITKEIDSINWNIEYKEVEGHQGDDVDVVILYLRFASPEVEDFTYKFRFPNSLLTSSDYGIDSGEKRLKVGLEKASNLVIRRLFIDFISTFHKDGWEEKVHKGSFIKHS